MNIVPYYQQSINPLVEGQAVYKIIRRVNVNYLVTSMRTLSYMSPTAAYYTMFPNRSEALAQHKVTCDLYRISTHLLGYVLGRRVDEGWGYVDYQVRWETKENNYTVFESESILIRLNDILILSPDELWTEIKDGRIAKR